MNVATSRQQSSDAPTKAMSPFPFSFFVTGFFAPYFSSRFKEREARMRLEAPASKETSNGKLSSIEHSGGASTEARNC